MLHADRRVRFAVDMTELNPIRTARLLALIEMPAPAIRASVAASFPAADAQMVTDRATAERAAFQADIACALSARAA